MKRNQLSGHQKRQKKLKAAEAKKLQMGSLDKFFGKKTTNSGDIGVPIENTDIRKEFENEATYTEFEQKTETEEPETQNLKDGLVENNVEETEKEIESFEFLFSMCIWFNLLNIINAVSKFLQLEDIDIDIALSRLEELINFFNEFRETGYDSCKKEAKELALELDVEPVFPEKRKIRRLVHFDDLGVTAADDDQNLSVEQKFRRYYFLYIVDQGAFQLKERFKQFQDYKEKFGFLFNLKKHLSGDDEGLKSCCMKLEGFLRHDMRYDIVGAELFNELLVFRMVIPDEITKAIDVLNYLSSSSRQINYPNAWIAYRIVVTIHVTVVEAERTFSRLKLIKSYLRSSMSQDRLNGLALLSIENELASSLDYSKIIERFTSQKPRKKFQNQ
ncbi:uncharacterized protein LOC141710286 [Apium graveolens]|uniref:uncharacterized protein LOC141710286 n=1 Tax=Apium graveolens TaxID=4045 RepID=UPI003D79B7F9